MTSGAGSAVSTKLLVEDFVHRYNTKIIKDIKIHCIKNKDDYVCHIMIPSEKNDEYEKPVYYDVVFEFHPLDKASVLSSSIQDYSIKAYSNNPTFIFNFTYVYYKENAIPSFIPRKYLTEIAIKTDPKKTNPHHLFGIDRSLFTALYHLRSVTNYRKNRLDLLMVERKSPAALANEIMGQQEKLDEVQIEEKKIGLRKKGDKKVKNLKSLHTGPVMAKKLKQSALIAKLDKNENKLTTGLKKDTLKNDLKNNMKNKLNSNFKSSLGSKRKS